MSEFRFMFFGTTVNTTLQGSPVFNLVRVFRNLCQHHSARAVQSSIWSLKHVPGVTPKEESQQGLSVMQSLKTFARKPQEASQHALCQPSPSRSVRVAAAQTAAAMLQPSLPITRARVVGNN